jgi:hypothetical protein
VRALARRAQAGMPPLSSTARPFDPARAVSFLDELKQQTRTQQPAALDAEAAERNRRLAHGACRLAHDYWKELVEQLNLIRPPSHARYVIDGRHPLAGLVCSNFRVLPQIHVQHNGEPLYESVMLAWQAGDSRIEKFEKEAVKDIERVRAALAQAGVPAHEAPVVNRSTGRPQATSFEFRPIVAASVRVFPLPDQGKVRLVFSNIDQLERVEAEYPAAGLRQRLLDEIGRWIVGQTNQVLEYAGNVKRFQH